MPGRHRASSAASVRPIRSGTAVKTITPPGATVWTLPPSVSSKEPPASAPTAQMAVLNATAAPTPTPMIPGVGDRKSVGEGERVSGRVELGGGGDNTKKK